jgi:hypothetical protein
MDKREQNDNGWRTDFLVSPFTKYEHIIFVFMGYVKEKIWALGKVTFQCQVEF